MRRTIPIAAAFSLLLLAAPVASGAESPQQSGPQSGGQKASSTTVPAAPTVSAEAAQTMEKIVREQEEMLSGKRFTYDPGGRRDPFRSLIEEVKRQRSARPKGIKGMSVAEVDLVGVVSQPSGPVAFVHGSDGRGYFLKPGDELYDGRLMAINPREGTATFRQNVEDPRQIKPYREVIKRLVPLEEEEG